MSVKKSMMMLAAMGMMAAMNPGYEPEYRRAPLKPAPKENRKKCKSCAEFYKGTVHCSCPWKNYLNPNDTACAEHYKKRKK